MTQAFEAALAQIMTVVSNVNGIAQAPPNPNETQNVYPFAVGYLMTGELGAGPIGTRKSLYNVAIDVLTVRMDLAKDLALLLPFIDTIKDDLLAEVSDGGGRFNNTISTFEKISILFLPKIDYAGTQMIGYRFTLNDLKILSQT